MNQGRDKHVIAYFFEFSSNFDFIGYESCRYCNALINVKKNYSFENINRMNVNDSNYDMIYLLKNITNSLRNFASYMNQYIFNNTVLDFQNTRDIGPVLAFNRKMSEILPNIVDELNHRLYLNEEFLGAYSELTGEGKRDYKKFKKNKNVLTKRR